MLIVFLNSHAYKFPLLTNKKQECKAVTSSWHPCYNSEKSFFITPNMLKEPSVAIHSAINNSLLFILIQMSTYTNKEHEVKTPEVFDVY